MFYSIEFAKSNLGALLYYAKLAKFADRFLYTDLYESVEDYFTKVFDNQGLSYNEVEDFVAAPAHIYRSVPNRTTGKNNEMRKRVAEWAA